LAESNPVIAVIGYKGVVGNATYQLLSRLNYNVVGIDVGDQPGASDIAFVCIPEGEVSPSVLRRHTTRLFVIRSTVPPLTCEQLQGELGIHVLHNPEFLREASSVVDEFNPDRIIIGDCCREHGDLVARLFEPLRRPIIRSSRRVTELTKIACNSWLAMVISYWNTIDVIAGKMDVSGTEVGMLASTDPRISSYGSRFHCKYGGKCLPKDIDQLRRLADSLGVKPKLLDAVADVNNECQEQGR